MYGGKDLIKEPFRYLPVGPESARANPAPLYLTPLYVYAELRRAPQANTETPH